MVEDAGLGASCINHTFFPNTKLSYYWSSTTSPRYTARALNVHFLYGRVYNYDKVNSYYVRVVRGGK